MPTIELGELAVGSRPGRAEPDRTATRRTNRRRPPRSGLLAAVLAGVLGTVAAGDPVPRPWPETVLPTRLGSFVYAERDRMFVVESDRPGRGGPELTAYRLPAAEPEWRVTLPADDVANLQMVGEHLLLARYPRPASGRAPGLTVLDPSTGAVAWDREASLMTVSSGGDLLLQTTTGAWRPGENGPGTLEAVDPATGAARWSLPVPAGAVPLLEMSAVDRAVPVRASTLVLVLPSGRVEVRDLGTGEVVRAAQMPAPGAGPPTPTGWVEVAAGLLLAYDENAVTAYGLPELDRRWSVPNPPTKEYAAFTCGADLCSLRPQRGVHVRDAGTGRTRWSDPRWTGLWTVGDDLVASQAGADESQLFAVLDPATGRVLADLGTLAFLTPRGSRFVGVRYGADRRAWVLEFDPVTWRGRLLTVLSGISGDCGVTATRLHCRRLDASTGVWRLPD
ncbi:PQQ-binding-like beta-propeller repeat protein [Plantactinospora sp. B6F1]|uniref:outer membrane protein assembly factor BamB family protein n=1 Tax=Plantactinospora sp. B6F1 TaxID=3158971 RepID=UPI0032D92C35